MRPSLTMSFISEAAETIATLRAALEKVRRATTLQDAHDQADTALEETLEEPDAAG